MLKVDEMDAVKNMFRGLLPVLRETLKNPQLVQTLKENYWFYGAAVLCSWVLAKYTGERFLFAFATFIYASFVGYAGHAVVHYINFTEMYEQCTHPILKNQVVTPFLSAACRYLDFHDVIHHDTSINRQIPNALTEFVLNFMNQGGLLMGMIYVCRHMNMAVVFLWAFAYCTVHNINYDYLSPVAHQMHHKDKTTNYGIDIWDILIGTKHPGDPIEDINHYAINLCLITAGIVLYLTD